LTNQRRDEKRNGLILRFTTMKNEKLTLKELRDKRQAKLDEANEILAGFGPDDKMDAETKKKFDALLEEARGMGQGIRFAEQGGARDDEIVVGRRSGPQEAGGETRTIKPGELRLLKNTEKLAQVYPPGVGERGFEGLHLGRLVSIMAGQPVDGAEVERRALSTFQDSLGGVTLPISVANQIFDAARAEAVCLRAGALTVDMLSHKIILPRLTQDVSGEWKAENAEAGESDTAFAGLELASRTWFVWLPISAELFQDATLLDAALQSSIASGSALAIDEAALFGNGEAQQPRGIYYDPDVSKTGIGAGANGYVDISDSMYRVENQNHKPTSVVMSPRSANTLRKLVNAITGEFMPVPVWMPTAYVTKQIPDDLGAGTNESAVITGDFGNLIIGLRDTLTISVLKEVKSQNNQIVICAAMRGDVGILRPAAFDCISGVLAKWNAAE
jgi:HK97 family phage major capsid protein